MQAKEAVQTAKACVVDLFADEGMADVRLEEIEEGEGDMADSWMVTIGFLRPDQDSIPTLLGKQPERSYKIVRIRNADGHILSVRDRILAGSLQ